MRFTMNALRLSKAADTLISASAKTKTNNYGMLIVEQISLLHCAHNQNARDSLKI